MSMFSAMNDSELRALKKQLVSQQNELLRPMVAYGRLPPVEQPGKRFMQLQSQIDQINGELFNRTPLKIVVHIPATNYLSSPPRKELTSFTPPNRTGGELGTPLRPSWSKVYLPPLAAVPAGGHPWFKYPPEQLV